MIKMGMKIHINIGELIIDEKYIIKPSMTVEEIKNSNLYVYGVSWERYIGYGNYN